MPGPCQAHDYFAKGTITMPDLCRIFAGVTGHPAACTRCAGRRSRWPPKPCTLANGAVQKRHRDTEALK
jgi:hypothetical protein